MRTNSTRNGPMSYGSPTSASCSSAARNRPCSSSLDLISPSVRRVAQTSRTFATRSRYGSAPTWSSCPCVSRTARTPPGRSARYDISGSTRSTPRCSSRGNARPASTTIASPAASYTVMFFPTSPRPPRGIILMLTGPSWHQPVTVTREERRLPDVCGADGLGRQPFEPEGEAAVRRHAVAERVQVGRERLGVEAAGGEGCGVVLVLVEALPARDDLEAAVQQVETA